MKKMTEIKEAIGRSAESGEIILLSVADPMGALERIDNDENVSELGWTDAEVGIGKVIDVWGQRMGRDFRIYIQGEEGVR